VLRPLNPSYRIQKNWSPSRSGRRRQIGETAHPGAVISVVKDGKLFFAKGYGVADLEKKTPVVPDKTIFRIGSITKVFTATAVMQLADRKKLKLTDDVNKYLTVDKVPNTFRNPSRFIICSRIYRDWTRSARETNIGRKPGHSARRVFENSNRASCTAGRDHQLQHIQSCPGRGSG
jgi:hypothetical protein